MIDLYDRLLPFTRIRIGSLDSEMKKWLGLRWPEGCPKPKELGGATLDELLKINEVLDRCDAEFGAEFWIGDPRGDEVLEKWIATRDERKERAG